MRVLFDQGTPVPLRRVLVDHSVRTAYEMGWATLKNGEFLSAAESAGFDALVTTDQSVRHQQSLAGRRLGVLVLLTTDWSKIRPHAAKVTAALSALRPGEFVDVSFE